MVSEDSRRTIGVESSVATTAVHGDGLPDEAPKSPRLCVEPFLLIDRTLRIVTAHLWTVPVPCDTYRQRSS